MISIQQFTRTILFSTIVLVGSFLLLTEPSSSMEGDTYAAIAVSGNGQHYGYSNKQESKRKAISAAKKQCRKQGKRCKIATWSTRCVALAIGNNGKSAGAWDAKKSTAISKAVRKCTHTRGKACKIKVAICN